MRAIIVCAALIATIGAANAQWRADVNSYGGNVTVTVRPMYYDNGQRHLYVEAPPNRCDKIGTPGFEQVSGARNDRRCYGGK